MSRERLVIRRLTLAVEQIGEALQLTPAEVVELGREGRVMGWIAEIWAGRLYHYERRANRNQHINGTVPAKVAHDVAVRTLNSHIKFQASGNQGKGRPCSQADVIAALERVETFVVIDLRAFPSINFLPLDTKLLLRAAHTGELTRAGWSAKRFDDWVSRTHSTTIVALSQSLPHRPVAHWTHG
jgi:hypothetical protein